MTVDWSTAKRVTCWGREMVHVCQSRGCFVSILLFFMYAICGRAT